MLTKIRDCDKCGITINNRAELQISTDKLSYRELFTSRLNENPSIVIKSPDYVDLCMGCLYIIINQIAIEQNWGKNQ